MFDTNAPVQVRLETPAGVKEATLRHPTDAEWLERHGTIRTMIRSEMSGGTVTEVEGTERAARKLFDAIRTGGEDSFDEFEAADVIERLAAVDVMRVERRGYEFDVRLAVPGGEVVHTLRAPTIRERRLYERTSILVNLGRVGHWVKLNLEAIAGLWSDLVLLTDGYAGEVPVIHKAAALRAAVEEAEAAAEAVELRFVSTPAAS